MYVSNRMKVDYIVVGQGLAGSAVAVQLMKLAKSLVVFDDAASNNSSRIAAGLFNPVTGKKMSRTWLADVIFPYLQQFYTNLESESGMSFFNPMPLYRPFVSIGEQNEWMVRGADGAYQPYIDTICTSELSNEVFNPYGGLLLRHCGFLDTQKYIQAIHILIERNASLCNEVFVPEELEISEDGVAYRQWTAKKLIWCGGVHTSGFFDWLPIHPLKGETLLIRARLNPGLIINRGVYMVPGPEDHWRVGSTYHFHDKSPGVTKEGRMELEEKINELIRVPFEVVDHQWGFRPTTPDRRPILGAHPDHKRLIVFNGLGTKGVSLAPYFSEVLIHWLEKGGTINKEVDIDRFK
jgi:glycine oxidase